MSYPKLNPKKTYVLVIFIALVGSAFIVSYIYSPGFFDISYRGTSDLTAAVVETQDSSTPQDAPLVVTHLKAPEAVKGIYMTSWIAGTQTARQKLIDLIDTTELNTIVIDIKDYTGRVSFTVEDPYLQKIGSSEKRIRNIKEFIDTLHKKNIYVIGRISSFQDQYLVKAHPEWAVKTKSGTVWKDRKGISWLDAGAEPVWQYLVAIAKESYAVGFDELQFDYIRFPSDGNMMDISYPFSEGKKKSLVLRSFFAYVAHELKGYPISADLFGMTTTNKDDLGIGQVLEDGLEYFDYVSPMVYPSHYPPHFNGYDNPNKYPYEIIKYVMESAVMKAHAASTSPSKLRPWLQDFDYGGDYDALAVRKQIQATYDAGLTSWLLWSASNVYTAEALLPKE